MFEARQYPLELQARIGRSKKWKRIGQFSISVSAKSAAVINQQLVVHFNDDFE